jgi:hypothetical protein
VLNFRLLEPPLGLLQRSGFCRTVEKQALADDADQGRESGGQGQDSANLFLPKRAAAHLSRVALDHVAPVVLVHGPYPTDVGIQQMVQGIDGRYIGKIDDFLSHAGDICEGGLEAVPQAEQGSGHARSGFPAEIIEAVEDQRDARATGPEQQQQFPQPGLRHEGIAPGAVGGKQIADRSLNRGFKLFLCLVEGTQNDTV